MKKHLTTSFLIFTLIIQSQNVNIPDSNFKNALINENVVDTNGDHFGDTDADTNNDGEIQVSEAEAVIGLNLFAKSINSLEGIEAFTNIEFLECGANPLISVDVSANLNLHELDASDCGNLENINVTQNIYLTKLRCGYTAIESLDISNNPALDLLYCTNSNLIDLDISQNPNIVFLNCGSNPFLTNLNIKNGNNTNLGTLIADVNPNLTCIDVDDVTFANNSWWTIDTWTVYSENCSTLGTEEVNQILFNLHPNPTTNLLSIISPVAIYKIAIFNYTGQLLMSSFKQKNIDVSFLNKGSYFIKITGENGKISFSKFLKN